MKVTFFLINFLLSCSVFGFQPTERDLEAAEAIASEVGDLWDFSLKDYALSDKSRRVLGEYSPAERIRGIASLVFKEDKDPRKGNRASTGKDYFNIVSNNRDFFQDVNESKRLLITEDSPRGVFLMTILASRVSKERRSELIPLLFNSLFMDGKVTKKEGEYTRDYWDDISKFSYEWIVSRLKKENSGYLSLDPDKAGIIPHELQVDHLARWLIANWPGCENYTLSDQNVPSILSKSSSNRVRKKGAEVEKEFGGHRSDSDFSWPVIFVTILLVASLGYWGFRRYSRN